MIRINLLPHKKVKPVDKGVLKLWGAAIAVAVVVLLGAGVWYVMLHTGIGDLKEQKAAAEKELAELKGKVAKVADYEKKRKDYESKLAMIAQIEKIKIPLTPALYELNRLVVKDVWIDNLAFKDAAFTINFKSTKKESVEPFFEAMQKSKVFSGLELDTGEAKLPKAGAPKSVEFKVTGKLAGYEDVRRPKAEVAKPAAKGKKPPAKGKKAKK